MHLQLSDNWPLLYCITVSLATPAFKVLKVLDNGPQAAAGLFVQCIDGVVGALDALELMRDEVVDLELSAHVTVDQLGNVRPALPAAERRALPHPSRDKLEGPSADLVPRRGDADDAASSPAPVSDLEGGSHDAHDAGAVERVVDAPLRQPRAAHEDVFDALALRQVEAVVMLLSEEC